MEDIGKELILLGKGIYKIFSNKVDTMSEEEMWYIYNEYSLGFDNYYGYAIPSIGHLTKFGKREVFINHIDEIKKKISGIHSEFRK